MIRAIFLCGLVALLFLLSLVFGATTVSPEMLWRLLVRPEAQDFVIWGHRLPRALLALLIGAGIGVSGTLIQAVIRNPLASPDLLGVTQGAGLMLSIGLLTMPGLDVEWLPVLSILGGGLGAAALMAYNIGNFSPLRFALSGVAMSACFVSVTEYLLLTHPVEINTALLSLTGSLWSRGWEQVGYALALIPLALAALPLSKALDLMGLGDASARMLGVRIGGVQMAAIGLSVALSGVAVAIAGPIGFVGLIAPHIARRLAPARMICVIPTSMAIGACVVMAADMVGRAIAPPSEIPVGVMTAVIGAPYFLWLLFRMR